MLAEIPGSVEGWVTYSTQ